MALQGELENRNLGIARNDMDYQREPHCFWLANCHEQREWEITTLRIQLRTLIDIIIPLNVMKVSLNNQTRTPTSQGHVHGLRATSFENVVFALEVILNKRTNYELRFMSNSWLVKCAFQHVFAV